MRTRGDASSREARLTDPRRLHALANSGLVDGDSDEVLTRLSRLATRVFGVPNAAVSLIDSERQFFAGYHGTNSALSTTREVPIAQSICQHVLAEDGPILIDDVRTDSRFDGRADSFDGVIAYAGAPLRTRDGLILGAFCVMDENPRHWTTQDLQALTDLTLTVESEIRTLSEARIAANPQWRNNALVQALIDNTPAVFSVKDRTGRYEMVNTQYELLYNTTRSEVIGRTDAEVLPHDLAVEFRKVDLEVLRSGKSRTVVERIPTAEGMRYFVTTKFALFADDGTASSVAGIAVDDSARRKGEEALLQSSQALAERNAELEATNQLKLDLIAMLSHDIGNPLTVIAGFAEIALDDNELSRETRSALSAIDRNARTLDRIRHEVLTMCQIEAGQLQAERRPVHVRAALTEALLANDLTVRVECPDDLLVLAHPVHLSQILANLLSNAGKYGGGVTGLSAATDGDIVEIRVYDEGDGVDAEFRDHLFERFSRQRRPEPKEITGVTTAIGSGLGLYIVKGLVEANGGKVRYEQNAPKGSVFVVRLDRAK